MRIEYKLGRTTYEVIDEQSAIDEGSTGYLMLLRKGWCVRRAKNVEDLLALYEDRIFHKYKDYCESFYGYLPETSLVRKKFESTPEAKEIARLRMAIAKDIAEDKYRGYLRED